MTNRINDLFEEVRQKGEIDRLEDYLVKLDHEELSTDEKESWHHLYGICAFRRKDRKTALERFEEGNRICPNSGAIAFSLGQEYEFIGDIDKMFSLFDKFRFPLIPANYALAEANYAYLWDDFDRAIYYINPILNKYFDLKIVDDHFLHSRGLPFFGRIWSYLAAFYILKGEIKKIREITDQLSEELSDYDFDRLFLFLDCVESKDFSKYIMILKEDNEIAKERGLSYGYNAMRVAVLEAQVEKDADSAEKILSEVELSQDDKQWLKDIHLLARCEIAKREKDSELERKLVSDFLARQPLLFEPDHVLNFNLLSYQERLKSVYRNMRLKNKI